MDCIPSATPALCPSSYSPIESDQVTSSATLPMSSLSLSLNQINTVSAQVRKERAARRTERRRAKQVLRLEARFTPSELAARTQRRFIRQQMKESAALLLKEACMKREIKRAKGALVSPKDFHSIDIHTNDHDTDEETGEIQQATMLHHSEVGAETETTRTETFAGLIIIQDYLSAMSQALAEHAKDSTLRTEPGRHSFYVDAAISGEDDLTGIAVVYKTQRQYWASEWTAKGFRIWESLDQWDAEAWAIWQALQATLEKTRADRAVAKPEDPCSVVVVYSDCKPALQRIEHGGSEGGEVVQKIIAQSRELQRLGVDVHLHWVPGHRNVPGNELADIVSKKARQPAK